MSKQEAQWQALAEQAERSAGAHTSDPQVDRYRLVLRALKQPTGLQLPADFANQLQQEVIANERRSAFEDGVVTVLMLSMVLIGLAVAYPFLVPVMAQLRGALPIADSVIGSADGVFSSVPWKAVIGAVLSVAMAMAMERLISGESEAAI